MIHIMDYFIQVLFLYNIFLCFQLILKILLTHGNACAKDNNLL